MDAPSMVQRSGDKFIVRSVVSGDQLFVDNSSNKQRSREERANSNNNNNNDSDEDTVNDLVINEDVLAEQDIDEEEEDDEDEAVPPQPTVQLQDDEWRQQLVKENLLQFMNQNMDTESLRWLLFNNNNSVMANKNVLPGASAEEMAAAATAKDGGDSSSNLPQCKIKRNYSCSNCTYFTQNPRQYLMHLRDTHGEKLIIHECKHCIYASRHYQKLVRHMKMVHGLSVDQDGSHLAIRKRGGPSLQQQQMQLQSQLLLNHLAATSAKRAKSSSAGSSVGADEINNNSVESSIGGGGGGGGEAKGGPSSSCRSSRSELINTLSGKDPMMMMMFKKKMDINNFDVEEEEEEEDQEVGGGSRDKKKEEEDNTNQEDEERDCKRRRREESGRINEIDYQDGTVNNNQPPPAPNNKSLINRSSLTLKPLEYLTSANNPINKNNNYRNNQGKFVSLLDLLNTTASKSSSVVNQEAAGEGGGAGGSEDLPFAVENDDNNNRRVDAKTETVIGACNDNNPSTVNLENDDDAVAGVNMMMMLLLQQQQQQANVNNINNFKSNHPALPPPPTTTKTTTRDTSETININATVNNATDDNNHCNNMIHHPNNNNNNDHDNNSHYHYSSPGSNPPPLLQSSSSSGRLLKCTVCDFEAASRELLAAHEAADHIKTKFFRCTKCNYVTHIRTRFSKHVKYHSMPMIKCNLCDFRTPYKWNLDRHMKNHGGSGPFKCAACNFTADIKQSLTVHEMNHHDPPVGSAAAGSHLQAAAVQQQQQLTTARRRNRVGASDAATAGNEMMTEDGGNDLTSGLSFHFLDGASMLSDHLKSAAAAMKRSARPIPNLIPIQGQPPTAASSSSALNLCSKESMDSRSQDSNSETSANEMNVDVDENSNPTSVSSAFKRKHGSFFDKLKEKIGTNGDGGNLTCPCSHVAKCLSELFIHQKSCQKFKQHQMSSKTYSPNLINNKYSSRCQYCRHRCKSSADLVAHMQNCVNAQLFLSNALNVNIEQDSASELDTSEKMMDEGEEGDEEGEEEHQQQLQQGHQQTMENRIFVWNKMPENAADNEGGSATGSEGNNPDLSMFTPQIKQEKMDDLDLSLEMHSTFRQSPSSLSDSPRAHHQQQQIHHHHQPMGRGGKDSSSSLKKVFKCPHCSFWASTASRFHVHIVGHLNKKPFECSLCAYRSNWRWDITKHIRLKTIRDPGHKTAKVLMNDETGRRNYTKYNKYITLMKVTEGDGNLKLMKSGEMTPNQEASLQSPHESSLNLSGSGASGGGGGGVSGSVNSLVKANNSLAAMQKLLLNDATSANLLKLSQGGFTAEDLLASGTDLSALLLASQQQQQQFSEGGGAGGEKKPTTFKCKKCNFKHPNRSVVQEHVKGHYRDEGQQHQQLAKANSNNNNNSPAVEITPIYNTTNNNIVNGLSADTNLLLANTKTLSNFLASQSLLPIIQAAAAATGAATNSNNNNNASQPNANGIVMSSGGTVDGNGGVVVVGGGGGGGSNNQGQSVQLQPISLATKPAPGLVGLVASNSSIGGVGGSTSNVCVKILPKTQLLKSTLNGNNNNNNILISPPSIISTAIGRKAQQPSPQTGPPTQHNVNNQAIHSNDHGEMDEASSGGTSGHNYRSQLSYRCGHCQQVSNWKHVIQRHCRLKHGGNINIEQIRSNRPTGGGGGSAQKPTTDSNSSLTINSNNNNNSAMTRKVTLQSPPPPLLAPLLRGATTSSLEPLNSGMAADSTDHQSKEMQAVQQRFSSLINSISSAVVGAKEGGEGELGNRKRQYDCAHCSYVTDNKSQFSYHKSLHKPFVGEELKCNYCSYTTTKRMLLTQHLRIHQSNPDDVIVVESENHAVFPKPPAAEEEELGREVVKENNKENQVAAAAAVAAGKRKKAESMCPYCPYSDANSELVNDHKQFHLVVSSERLKFSCEFCDFNAHSEKTMKDHRKLHFSFLEKGNAAAVEFCTTYDKLKLFVAASAASSSATAASNKTQGASKDKKIYDEEEIEDENPWMHSANTSTSSAAGGQGGVGTKMSTSGQSKGLSKGRAGGGGKAAINV